MGRGPRGSYTCIALLDSLALGEESLSLAELTWAGQALVNKVHPTTAFAFKYSIK